MTSVVQTLGGIGRETIRNRPSPPKLVTQPPYEAYREKAEGMYENYGHVFGRDHVGLRFVMIVATDEIHNKLTIDKALSSDIKSCLFRCQALC